MALGRMYTVTTFVSATAAADLFELNAPSDASVRIHSFFVENSSDAGDSEAEMLRWQVFRGHTTSGSGGGSPSVEPQETGGAAFGGTVEGNNTTVATAGTPDQMFEGGFNVMSGLNYRPTPEERIVVSPSQRIVFRLTNAPADSINLGCTLIFEEIGG